MDSERRPERLDNDYEIVPKVKLSETMNPVVNVQASDDAVSEFELDSRYYIHFRTITQRKVPVV